MALVRTCFFLLIIFTFVTFNHCGRWGGGGRSSGGYRPSSSGSRTRISSPSTSWHPSPSRVTYRPASQPRITYRPATQRPIHVPTTRRVYYPSSARPTVTSRPVNNPITHRPIEKVTSRPVNNPVTQRPPHGFTTRRPVGPTHTTRRSYPITTHRSYPSGSVTSRPSGWNLPPRPAASYSYPQGPPKSGYPHGYSHGYTSYHGPSKVKIVNKYNYHYPGYYSLPVQSSYPGYYHYPSYYHYSSHDTGSTALGFFLGYGLAKLTTPTYSHYRFYDGYTPRYDHYTVHHYYHNRESVPARQEIPANTIVGCVGDSSTVCPGNTTSLCTSEGTLMCVVSATSTTPCTDNRQVNCVKSTITCVNNSAPECKNANQDTVSIDIPCVSSAEVYGSLKYVDNTIIIDVPANETANNTLTVNSTLTTNNSSTNNNTLTADDILTTTTPQYSTKYPITTTPTPEKKTNETVQKEKAQNFCVTVIAVPAAKRETEGEQLYDDAKDIASKFFESVWGL